MTILLVLLALWILLELTAQLARWDIIKVWTIPLPGDRGGITLHPLLVLVTVPRIIPHERIHARQMARLSWIGYLLLYAFSGRWRARLEAEAYAGAARAPRGPSWAGRVAETIRGPIYFPSWWPIGRDPGQTFVEDELRRNLR